MHYYVTEPGWRLERNPLGESSLTYSEDDSVLGFKYSGTTTVLYNGKTTSMAICNWFIALIFAILPTIWLIKWRKRRAPGDNACAKCGYDLTGNESGKCSECGEAVGET